MPEPGQHLRNSNNAIGIPDTWTCNVVYYDAAMERSTRQESNHGRE